MSDIFVLQEADLSDSDNTTYTPIPEDEILDAEVVSIQKVIKPFKDENGNEIERVEFSFKITDGEYASRKVYGDTPTTFTTHPDCKLRAWVSEILGADIPAGFKFDPDTIVGLPVRIVIGAREANSKKYGKYIRNFVKDCIRSRAAAIAANHQIDEEPF